MVEDISSSFQNLEDFRASLGATDGRQQQQKQQQQYFREYLSLSTGKAPRIQAGVVSSQQEDEQLDCSGRINGRLLVEMTN